LERSQFAKDILLLCTFDRNGKHANYGPLSEAEFEQRALDLASNLLNLAPFREYPKPGAFERSVYNRSRFRRWLGF
jgi:hypothetical protein